MKIVLIGYMGSGKSSIGVELSSILDYKFLDTDSYIERKEKQSIPSIFETKGEIYFRKAEKIKGAYKQHGKLNNADFHKAILIRIFRS